MDKKRRHKRNPRRARTRDVVAHLPQEGFVRLPTVLAVYPVSKSTWWEGVKAGKYPAPVKLGPNITAWKVGLIRQLIESS